MSVLEYTERIRLTGLKLGQLLIATEIVPE